MLIENTSSELHRFGETLFRLVEDLGGAQPRLLSSGDWYRAGANRSPVLYLRFVGDRARKFPANSVHLAAKWDDRLALPGVQKGNSWYGSHSADLSARPDNPEEVALAERFIRSAFQLRAR